MLSKEELVGGGRLPAPNWLHVLTLPDFERAERIGDFWGYR